LKPIFPKVRETRGAGTADGAAIVAVAAERAAGTATRSLLADRLDVRLDASATGTLVLASVDAMAAEAGRAKEAARTPETAITAMALAAGWAVCEMATERDDGGFS
jgi:heme/copper-type cytochrome/quinol oxidase subunit 3